MKILENVQYHSSKNYVIFMISLILKFVDEDALDRLKWFILPHLYTYGEIYEPILIFLDDEIVSEIICDLTYETCALQDLVVAFVYSASVEKIEVMKLLNTIPNFPVNEKAEYWFKFLFQGPRVMPEETMSPNGELVTTYVSSGGSIYYYGSTFKKSERIMLV